MNMVNRLSAVAALASAVGGRPENSALPRRGARGERYTSVSAATGHEGLRMATMRLPDVVMSDLGLPTSGLDVIKRLREWYVNPIIVLSARSQEADKVSALDLGADDYLTKPFGIGELLARLRVARRHIFSEESKPAEPDHRRPAR